MAADILCTHDLTPVSDTALAYAVRLAERMDSRVTLLHVIRSGLSTEERQTLTSTLERAIAQAEGQERVRVVLNEGRFMQRITEESAKEHALAILGTHGPHGLRQNLFGADILKLVRSLGTPSVVVQKDSNVEDRLDRIVLPVAAHAKIDRLLDAVCMLARLHTSEVHVYQLMRPNESPSDELLKNKLHMLQRLQTEGIRHLEANVPSDTFSVGFAGPTIQYAQRIGAGCIAIMVHASDEYRYIADAEKERLLTNDAFIPVLCA